MPEGDSLHRAAARLRPLVGLELSASSPHPRGLVTGVAAAVDGRRLEGVEAVGKHLLLRFEGGVTVRSHLRMSGRWRVGPVGSTGIGSIGTGSIGTGSIGTGRPWLVLRGEAIEATQWNGPVLTLDTGPVRRLGPDLLAEATEPRSVVGRIRATDPGRPLGEVLQDQRLVAGIGNMWMSETLWAARLSPWLSLRAVADEQLLAALEWSRAAMRASVAGARPQRAVYRRVGRPCPRCGTPIASRGQGDDNRTAYWCPACQPAA